MLTALTNSFDQPVQKHVPAGGTWART